MSKVSIRGVVCAGGHATRLGEMTRVANKHLLPVGDCPMIYYPLDMLQVVGIHEICIVTGPDHAGQFIELLGDGQMCYRGTDTSMFNLDLTYRVQAKPGGIAQAIALAENFANKGPILVVLGDNLAQYTIGPFVRKCNNMPNIARILLAQVDHPEQYGVAELTEDKSKIIRIIEKPTKEKGYDKPPSDLAVTGIYYYPPDVFEEIGRLEPSERGELEITDINNQYLKNDRLAFDYISGWWEDAGESAVALAKASDMVLRTGANNILLSFNLKGL